MMSRQRERDGVAGEGYTLIGLHTHLREAPEGAASHEDDIKLDHGQYGRSHQERRCGI